MSETKLRMCSECSRHVFAKDVACPFCGAKQPSASRAAIAVAAAAVAAAGIAVSACGDKPPATSPTNPNANEMMDAGGATTTPTGAPTAPDVKRGDKNPAPVYGGPPP